MVPSLRTVFSNAFVEDIPSENNHTELFGAIHEKDWNKSLQCLNLRPQEAKTWSSKVTSDGEITWKRLPIHEACIHNAPQTVIATLLQAFPESYAAIDLNNRLPLHHAALHGASYEVIKLLVNASPGAVNAVDIYGKTPIVCLMSFHPSGVNAIKHNQKIQLLSQPFSGEPLNTFGPDHARVQYYAEGDSSESRYTNYTTLMGAVKDRRWEEALEEVERHPLDAKAWTTHFDSYGDVAWTRLPLHEACINNAPLHVIEALIQANKEGSKSADQNNRLPLHHAAVHGSDIAVVKLLINDYPESLDVEDLFGKTPLKCLKSPSLSALSMHNLTMEALSKPPSYYKNSPAKHNANSLTNVENELEELKKRLFEEQKERMSLNKKLQEIGNRSQENEIEELKKRLLQEQKDRILLNGKLEEIVNRSQVLEEIMIQKSCENECLKQSLNALQREYTKLEMDVFSQGGSVSRDDRYEVDSLMSNSMLSYDARSRPIDNVVLKDKSIKNLKAEMKERESMLERALTRAKSPMTLE